MKRAQTQEAPAVWPLALVLLFVASLAESLLSLYQWMELMFVRAGGSPTCALNETLNCGTVWTSSFASNVHALTGMPLAGLGLVWGLTAFGLSAVLMHRAMTKQSVTVAVGALRLWSALGVLSCVTFAVASIRIGSWCLTCLGTYAIVLSFAIVALRLLPGPVVPKGGEWKGAVGWAAGLALISYLVLLYPGLTTPKSTAGNLPTRKDGATTAKAQSTGPVSDADQALVSFLDELNAMEKKGLADALDAYIHARPLPPAAAPRTRMGSAEAPMKVVEFTDLRCGHCRALVEMMKQIAQAVPPNSFSVEARHFPLDKACNPAVQREAGGVSCVGAKAQICLEQAPDFWQVRERLFEAQERLTSAEEILKIASSGSMGRAQLEACIAHPETQSKLDEDIRYAQQYNPRGTPIVLINGKEAMPSGAFLFAMALARGNANHPLFGQHLPMSHAHGGEGLR